MLVPFVAFDIVALIRARAERNYSVIGLFWGLATAFSAARPLSVVGRPLGPSDMHGAADARPGATVSRCQTNHLCADEGDVLLVCWPQKLSSDAFHRYSDEASGLFSFGAPRETKELDAIYCRCLSTLVPCGTQKPATDGRR